MSKRRILIVSDCPLSPRTNWLKERYLEANADVEVKDIKHMNYGGHDYTEIAFDEWIEPTQPRQFCGL